MAARRPRPGAQGTLAGLVRTGVTVDEAAAEFLRYLEHDRARKPATIRGYRWLIDGHVSPAFGDMRIEDVTPAMVEAWSATLPGTPASRRKIIVTTHGIFQRARRAFGLPSNPVADVEKPPLRRSGDIEVYSPEEVWALVRAADSEQDAALYLTAAFTGLRMGELIALRWRDVDFPHHTIRVRASYAIGHLTTPGRARFGPSRSHPTWQARSRDWASAGSRQPTTTSSSSAVSAVSSTAPRCAAATRRHSRVPAYARCASTTCATPSARG